MSTLLQKAQQALTEKQTKVIPANIKKDVTIFNITGNYGGGTPSINPIIHLTNGQEIAFHAGDLADYLDENLTAEQKAARIETDMSYFVLNMYLSTNIDLGYLPSIGVVGLEILEQESAGLNLVYATGASQVHVLTTLCEKDSSTEGYFPSVMTAEDFITLLRHIGNSNFTISTPNEQDFYCYTPSMCIFKFPSIPNFVTENIGIELITDPIPDPRQEYTLTNGDNFLLYGENLADLIEANTTAAEREEQLNQNTSGCESALTFITGVTLHQGTAPDEQDYNLCLSSTSDSLFLSIVTDDGAHAHNIDSNPIIKDTSCYDYPYPLTVGGLISLLKDVGSPYIHIDMQSDYSITFKYPFTEIVLKGQTFEKTIQVPNADRILTFYEQ